MTDDEFDGYVARAVAELKSKQRFLEAEFGLGRYERYFIDYDKEELQFTSGGRIVLSFAITAVGSYLPGKKSWLWSWANESLPDNVRKKASAVRQLSDLTGVGIFAQRGARIEEATAYELVALSCRLFGALGAYLAPQQDLRTYVLLDRLTAKTE